MAATLAQAGNYMLASGKQITGEPALIDDKGVKFKLASGEETDWITWEKLPQAALQTLLVETKSPAEQSLVRSLLDDAPAAKNTPKITVKEPVTPQRPQGLAGLTALATSPLAWLILAILEAASILAGLQIAHYKRLPRRVVCGLAAVPVVGMLVPIAFLFLSKTPGLPTETRYAPVNPDFMSDSDSEGFGQSETAAPTAPEVLGGTTVVVFAKPDFLFERRFFETKLASFQRLIPSDTDKDMFLWIKTLRGEFTGRRITQVTDTNLHLLLFKADATADEVIPYEEILEVQIRRKESIKPKN